MLSEAGAVGCREREGERMEGLGVGIRLVEGWRREMLGRDPAPPGLPQPPAFTGIGAAQWLPVDVGLLSPASFCPLAG